jgi:hypothetical protein
MEFMIAAAGVALMVLPSAAQARCKSSSVYFSGPRAETEGEMTVVSGTSCWSGVGGIPGALSEVKITQPPKVGRAGVSNMRPYYMAKPGYQGADEFTYTYIGTDQYGGPMRVSIKRKITVVPSL